MEEAARNIHKLIKGSIRDEYMIIREISHHTKTQRQEIKKAYLNLYNTKLEDDLKSNLGGSFLSLVLALFEPTSEYEARCLKSALRETLNNIHNVRIIVQIMCTKNSSEIKELAETYKKLFGHNLMYDIEKEESGDLGKLLLALAVTIREENSNIADNQSAYNDAYNLLNAEKAAVGIDDEKFIEIFTTRSFTQLNAIFDSYKSITNIDIEKSVKDKFDGSLELALICIIKTSRNVSKYFVKQIHHAIKKLRNSDEDLIRLLVIRAEVDLASIKTEYKQLYNKSLYESLSEAVNDHQKFLLLLVGHD